ncbi:CorA family divalent cation transporter [Nocardia amamiensis]|uniref:CorA family divalent cation transporter n=1 Tax=Nocardia amamiensis TaxID=404578 RepID=UPI0008356164|nr:CorA family divalent cation transporter [Nocardia amamiensis]
MTIFLDAVTADHFDTEVLQQHWIPLARADTDTSAVLRERLGVDFAAAGDRVWETDDFLYFPVAATYQRGETIERETIVFALGSEFLVTLQPSEHFPPFDRAVAKMRRNPELTGSPHGVMYALLWALNETSERVIRAMSATLAQVHDEIETVTGGRAIDLRAAMSRMDAAEQNVARIQETQLQLARAARHLAADMQPGHRELDELIGILLADIDGVKQHAGIQHDKVRYLQQSVLAWSALRQHRIVTVLTAISAIFLPPTLIATLYTWLPDVQWQYGFLVATALTLLAAALPLAYIKKKGWLR